MDVQATCPVDPRVLDVMLPYETFMYGNPHSKTHHFGWEAETAVEAAREHVGQCIGATGKEIVFTSGATESNNLAIKGISRFYKSSKKKHIITTQTEHKCILDSCRALEQEGFEVTYLPVKPNGLVDLEVFEAAITPATILASVMFVNNEIGVIQPIGELGGICRKHKVIFHSDAAQALGKISIDVEALNVDAMSLSSHKIYGPKGAGGLYLRRRNPRVRVQPLFSGGGQERGLRSGTLATPLCVGFGEACRVAMQDCEADHAHISRLSRRLYDGIMQRIPRVILNGDATQRFAGNLNMSFSFVEGESLLMALKEIAVSSGSACTSASLEPSYVLRALGVEEDLAHTSLRFGIGRFTTEAEIDYVIALLDRHVNRLREMSPLWEMVQEGIDLKTIQWTSSEH